MHREEYLTFKCIGFCDFILIYTNRSCLNNLVILVSKKTEYFYAIFVSDLFVSFHFS